jgi:hypothetical protein
MTLRTASFGVLLLAACSSAGQRPPGPRGTGGDGGAGDPTGGAPGSGGGPATGGVSGSGGTAGSSGSGGGSGSGGAGGAGSGGSGGAADAASASDARDGAGSTPPTPGNYGGVGEKIPIPLQYSDTPVPPLVAPECPDDPTQGYTEYKDTFVIQRPYDLAAAARFKIEDGIYTFFVNSSDKAHEPGNTTAPRTEARYPNFSSGEHIWAGDVLLDSPLSKTCIFQIHNVEASIAVYLRVVDGRLFHLSTGQTILPSSYGKWFNLKVALNTQSHQVRVFVNNCLKETSQSPSGPTPNWYFKHGTYTCDSGTCRDHYKNIHVYQK